ncbi:MAG: pilus assembly FimT family protein, partial [Lysobacterales bacterium]
MKDLKSVLEEAHASRRVHPFLLIVMALLGVLFIGIPGWLTIQNLRIRSAANHAVSESQAAVDQVKGIADSLRQVLDDEPVQLLATLALANPAKKNELEQYLAGRVKEIRQVQLYLPDLATFDPGTIEANGYALLEMFMTAEKGLEIPLQIHGSLKPPMLVDAAVVRSSEAIAGYLVILLDPEYLLSHFAPEDVSTGYISLTQNNGRQAPTTLKQIGQPARAGEVPDRQQVPGTLFRVEMPMVQQAEFLGVSTLVTFLLFGLLTISSAVFLYRKNEQWESEHRPEHVPSGLVKEPAAEAIPGVADNGLRSEVAGMSAPISTPRAPSAERRPVPAPLKPDLPQKPAQQPDPPPMRLRYDVQE